MREQEREANIISPVMPFTDGIGPILSRTLPFSPFSPFSQVYWVLVMVSNWCSSPPTYRIEMGNCGGFVYLSRLGTCYVTVTLFWFNKKDYWLITQVIL